MERVINLFSTREWAIIFWISILGIVLALVMKKKLLTLMLDLLKVFFGEKKMIKLHTSILTWTLMGALLIVTTGQWENFMLKYIFYSVIFLALPSCFKLATEDGKKSNLKSIVKKTIAISLLIQFVADMFTFGFWTEVLLVLVMFIFAMLGFAFSHHGDERSSIYCDRINIVIGLVVIFISFVQFFQNFDTYIDIIYLRKFLFKPFIILWYMPLFFVFAQICLFERVFIQLKVLSIKTDKKLVRRFKYRLIQKSFFKFEQIENLPLNRLFEMNKITSKCEVDGFIDSLIVAK